MNDIDKLKEENAKLREEVLKLTQKVGDKDFVLSILRSDALDLYSARTHAEALLRCVGNGMDCDFEWRGERIDGILVTRELMERIDTTLKTIKKRP